MAATGLHRVDVLGCATHMLEGGADIRYIQQLLVHEKLEATAICTEITIRHSSKSMPAATLRAYDPDSTRSCGVAMTNGHAVPA